jgi:hypothetical protein
MLLSIQVSPLNVSLFNQVKKIDIIETTKVPEYFPGLVIAIKITILDRGEDFFVKETSHYFLG